MTELAIIERTDERPILALELPKETSFDEWVDIGRRLSLTNKALQWHIGDWWAFGDHRYGERAKAAAEGLFGREFQTIANMASVCRSIKTSRRREHLSFAHHAEVAALAPKQADVLLERAERDNWTRNDIRAQVNEIRRATHAPQRSEPEPEELEWSALVGHWNRASRSVRRRMVEAQADLGIVEILDSSDAALGPIDPFEC